jgi:hypothetical protein
MANRASPRVCFVQSSCPFTLLSNTQFNFVTVNFNGASRIRGYLHSIEGADDMFFFPIFWTAYIPFFIALISVLAQSLIRSFRQMRTHAHVPVPLHPKLPTQRHA